MAFLQFSPLTLGISLGFLFLLFSPVRSLTCSSQKFTNNRYSNCTDLPHLNAYLHYTYNASNSSLSIAYVAAPAKAGGWVAWALNPTGEGMKGAQALIAFKSNDNVTVNTYNISSYSSIVPSKLSFDVWDLRAEESNGNITIFASLKVPEKAEKLNQVWQVGPSVTDGKPAKHEFQPSNLNAKGALEVASSSQNATESGSSDHSGGASIIRERFGLGLYMGLIFILVGCINL